MVGRVVKLALLVGFLALSGLLLFRPATLFGVDGDAVASSLGNAVRHSQARCAKQPAGRWRCALEGEDFGGVEYVVTIESFGCWKGLLVPRPPSAATARRSVSGCIGLGDEFGR